MPLDLSTLLKPVIDALTPCQQPPKTQAVIQAHLALFVAALDQGFTYLQLAKVLNESGARMRTGAMFTGGSLSSMVRRAKLRKPSIPQASVPTAEPIRSQMTKPMQTSGTSRNVNSDSLDVFVQRIEEAQSNAADDKILFSRRPGRHAL